LTHVAIRALLDASFLAARPSRHAPRVSRWWAIVAAGALGAASPGAAPAQQPEPPPQLGLGASSAIGVHAGAGIFKHAALGTEVGATLDLGWIGSRRARLAVGLDYLATTIDRADSLGVRGNGRGYVFTAFADVNFLMSLARRVAPYAGLGFGVDAVGTTIQNEQIGALYNTNVFNLHGQAGALVRLTPRGRLKVELHAVTARVVPRVGVRLGYTLLYNELGPKNSSRQPRAVSRQP